MAKLWSQGGPNPFPKWVQFIAFHLSDWVQFVGVLLILGAFAAAITEWLTGAMQPGVMFLAFIVVGVIQTFLWIIGDDIRKEKSNRKTSVSDQKPDYKKLGTMDPKQFDK